MPKTDWTGIEDAIAKAKLQHQESDAPKFLEWCVDNAKFAGAPIIGRGPLVWEVFEKPLGHKDKILTTEKLYELFLIRTK